MELPRRPNLLAARTKGPSANPRQDHAFSTHHSWPPCASRQGPLAHGNKRWRGRSDSGHSSRFLMFLHRRPTVGYDIMRSKGVGRDAVDRGAAEVLSFPRFNSRGQNFSKTSSEDSLSNEILKEKKTKY